MEKLSKYGALGEQMEKIKKQQRAWVDAHQCDMEVWKKKMVANLTESINHIKDPNNFFWKNQSKELKENRIKALEKELEEVLN